MRPWLLAFGVLGVCLGVPSPQFAQEPLSLPPAPTPWEIAMPRELPAAPPLYASRQPPPTIVRNPFLDVDFLIGVPLAARVGLAVFRHDEHAVLLEGMVGLDYVIIPFVAAGARYRFVAWHGQHSQLVIKPGVDAYAGVIPFGGDFAGVGCDVACVFLHNGPHLGFEWGVDFGAIGVLGVHHANLSGVVPLVSFILGVNF